MTWWRSLSVLLCILVALMSPRTASGASAVQAETRVKGFLLVAPTLIGGSTARNPEKHPGNAVAYDERGALVVKTDRELVPGVSVRLNSREAQWPALVDARAGWVCLERPGAQAATELEAVEFAPGCVAVLNDGELVALWLHPQELPADVRGRLPS